jgi:nitrite reductase/ring-hydroxylating ferredoxin subunit
VAVANCQCKMNLDYIVCSGHLVEFAVASGKYSTAVDERVDVDANDRYKLKIFKI